MVSTDSLWLVPPHIQPPMAHVPSATRETLSCVLGISTNSGSTAAIRACVDGDIGSLLLVRRVTTGCLKSVPAAWPRWMFWVLQKPPRRFRVKQSAKHSEWKSSLGWRLPTDDHRSRRTLDRLL